MNNIDIDKINAWENGEMSAIEEITFFQELIDSGDAWKLQGFYGSNAHRLIEEGLCHFPEKRLKDYYGNTVPSCHDIENPINN